MKIYEVEFTGSASKELSKLSPKTRLRVAKAIYKLRSDPKKGNVRQMVGTKSWRLRVGDHRAIYDIYNQKLLILIIKVAHRREVYRK